MTKFCRLLAAIFLPFSLSFAATHEKAAAAPYHGAIVTDAETGQILFEDHADEISPPASMTKLMTFAVLHDKLVSGALTLATPVTASAADSKIGGTQVWLKEKETFTVEELLYAMMIQSANDAAHALACTTAGSAEAFVELMNTKARELGMTHTTFRSPHGLPPANRRVAEGDLTTPRDYAILSRHLLLHTDVTKYTSVRQRKFGEGQRTPDRVIEMNNHNHLLGKVAGLDGLKTGFTNGAGYCLAATAQRDGRRIITVVMGSPDSKIRDIKTTELIQRGFAAAPALAVSKMTPGAPPAALVKPGGAVAGAAEVIPTVKTDKTPPSATEQSSTAKDPVFTFRVIPPEKKP